MPFETNLERHSMSKIHEIRATQQLKESKARLYVHYGVKSDRELGKLVARRIWVIEKSYGYVVPKGSWYIH